VPAVVEVVDEIIFSGDEGVMGGAMVDVGSRGGYAVSGIWL